MRLYFAFITGIAGWIGVSFYHFCMPDPFSYYRSALILGMLFLSYGINQVVNDYCGMEEDRINAPNRPMVTGELNPRIALGVSTGLMVGVIGLSWFLGPWSIVPVILGVLLNILYEFAKAWSLIGNIVFGLSIAGKRTFVVKYGLRIARYAGVVGAFLPTLAFFMFQFLGWLPQSDILFQRDFVFCGVITLFLQIWTAILFFIHPVGDRTYFSYSSESRFAL